MLMAGSRFGVARLPGFSHALPDARDPLGTLHACAMVVHPQAAPKPLSPGLLKRERHVGTKAHPMGILQEEGVCLGWRPAPP